MTMILLVDDRATNREYLTTLLKSSGYDVTEATDGAEALVYAKRLRPDLIIADIVMPKLDGYEFIRRLRNEPEGKDIPVIFLSAHYAEDEIRRLSASCSVFHILTKPIEPEVILSSVSEALSERATATDPPLLGQFDRDHLRLLTDKLARKAEQLEVANHRLRSLVELGSQLGAERDPRHLLSSFCQSAAEIFAARYALVAIVEQEDARSTGASDNTLQHILAYSDNPNEVGIINAKDAATLLVERFFGDNRVALISDATQPPHRDQLSKELASLRSLLIAPIHTGTSRYGLLCIGGFDITGHDDESLPKLAASMGSVLGVAYENALRYEQIDRHAEKLRREVAERAKAQEQVQRLNTELEQRVADRTAELDLSHQRLRQSERMAAMGTFSAGLGHDITNMLLPIRGHLDALQPNLPEQEFQERTNSIRHCVDYLRSLTRGLRLLTLDPENEDTGATTDIEEWSASVQPLLKSMVSNGVQLRWDCTDNLPAVTITSHRLTQALFNLVKNASDVLKGRTDGEIRVKINESDTPGMMRFKVTDNGPGMSEEVRKRAMEPFFTTKAREFSTGLGLSMVYGIAKGNMTLQSKPGNGTTVSIDIPIVGHSPEVVADGVDPAVIQVERGKELEVRS